MNNEVLKQPYVVSQDVGRLVTNWGLQTGVSVPSESYFVGITDELKSVLKGIFKDVDIIDDKVLSLGMRSMVEKSDLPVISLDRCYIDKSLSNLSGFFDVSRCLDENFDKFGISGRSVTSIYTQLDQLASEIYPNKEIAIIDDVLFEGNTHKYVYDLFKSRGITVSKVLVGISIGDGKKMLESHGINVESVVHYDSVIDEICERDFLAGVPFSGRTIITNTGIYGAPYFEPFGKPVDWASIPVGDASLFSNFCVDSSLNFWRNIERKNRRQISTEEVPKKVFNLNKNDSIVDALSCVRENNI